MMNSELVGAFVVAASFASAGIGYAVSTSPIYLNGSATAGTASIAWVPSNGAKSPTTVMFSGGSGGSCTAPFTSTSVSLTTTDLSPLSSTENAVCALEDTITTGNSLNITNPGGFVVKLNDTVDCGSGCTLWGRTGRAPRCAGPTTMRAPSATSVSTSLYR
jgi:hypothetical protein